jgi:hypothetical protein
MVLKHGSDVIMWDYTAGGKGGGEAAVPAAEGAEAERRRGTRTHRAPQSETDETTPFIICIISYPVCACHLVTFVLELKPIMDRS